MKIKKLFLIKKILYWKWIYLFGNFCGFSWVSRNIVYYYMCKNRNL